MKIPEITPEIAARFWSKVEKDGPVPAQRPELGKCWVWTAASCKGYGKFMISGRPGRLFIAPRISYFISTGKQPDPFHVCHRCDNSACVNPNHLFLGTDADNLSDMRSKGRGYLGFKEKPCPPEKRQKGSSVPSSKLTEKEVLEIVNLLNAGHSQKAIAEKFCISKPQISYIKNGITWSHLTGIKKPH